MVFTTFDATLPSGLAGGKMVSGARCELYEDQVIVVQIKRGSRSSLLFIPAIGSSRSPEESLTA